MKNCFVHIIFVLEVLGISSGYNNLLLDVIKRILVKVISLVDATGRGVINLSLFYLFDFHKKGDTLYWYARQYAFYWISAGIGTAKVFLFYHAQPHCCSIIIYPIHKVL